MIQQDRMYGVKFNGILQGYVDKRGRNRQSFGKMPMGVGL